MNPANIVCLLLTVYKYYCIIWTEIARLQSQGVEVINLGIGEPDFDTPSHISQAMFHATQNGATHYTPNKGILDLRKAIIRSLEESYGLTYDPEEIITTAGVAEGVYISLTGYLNPGDEVLVPDPAWVSYSHIPVMNGAKPVPYILRADNSFQIDVEALEELVTDATKILVLLDPSNPTGAVQSRETIEKLAAFAVRHDLIVIYDGAQHHPIATFPGMRERTILLNGFSKTYAMTGWRLGYLAAPMALIPPMAKLHAYIMANAPPWCSTAAWRPSTPLRSR